MTLLTEIIAFFASLVALFCSWFDIPFYAVGDSLDMSKLELTFEDNFDTLDRTVWSGHYVYGDTSSVRRGGYWNNQLAYTENGNLIIPLKYLSEGMGGAPAGWYTAGIDTDGDALNGFSQQYGYFECRCILPAAEGIWSAFWMLNDGVYNEDGSGRDGTEIDIFESLCYGDINPNAVSSNLHYDGYGEALTSMGGHKTLLKGNPYEEFNTYGILWTEDEYIFYINGKESFRSDFGGVSQNPEYMILSMEVAGENGICTAELDTEKEYDFIVDYVKAYKFAD